MARLAFCWLNISNHDYYIPHRNLGLVHLLDSLIPQVQDCEMAQAKRNPPFVAMVDPVMKWSFIT